jgi:L-methionine (R)-S-oxide reductase
MDNAGSLSGRYRRVFDQLREVLTETRSRVARLSTAAAVLHGKMPHFSWTGFYLLEDGDLVVGPYQGPLACPVLRRAEGVCWAAVNGRRTILVPDVRRFPGHIACDARARSEIAIPLQGPEGRVWGVLDVDSHRLSAFSEADRAGLERIAGLL